MSRIRSAGRLVAVVSLMTLSAASPAMGAPGDGGDAGGADTGDVFADLIVAWRDVNGVPLLQPYTVDGEAGPVTEYCVQPVSYAPLPGMTVDDRVVNGADGRDVYRIPLMGDLADLAAADEVCDPQPAYAMYVTEAELERLNMVRQPDTVQAKKLEEVTLRLLAADEITLDGAGRITTDGVPIDAAPDHAAMFASLMTTGSIPGLGSSPAAVRGFDAWMLAAAAIGTASGKEVPLTIDAVQYYVRISEVTLDLQSSLTWNPHLLRTSPPGGEQFLDFGDFSYRRSDVFTGCVTWLDVPSLTWKVSAITDVVDFAPLPPVARDTDGDGTADTVDNVAGFAQLADDVRSVILYLHANEVIAGFFMDPVFERSCATQVASLTEPAVQWARVPTDLIQTDTVSVATSAFMPWAGTTVDAARLRVTIDDADEAYASGMVTATATDGPDAGQAIVFGVESGDLVGWWPPTDLTIDPGYTATTTFDLTVAAGAPTGASTLTLELVDTTTNAVLASSAATTNVADAMLTVLWATEADFATQGTFVPLTTRVFNPDLGQDPPTGVTLRLTVDAPDPFVLAGQVAVWNQSVSMTFVLDANGNLVGEWPLVDPLPVPYDEQLTWYLNAAEGSPLGLYALTMEIRDDDVTLSTDVTDVTVGAAATHGGGGGGGDDGGGDDGTLPPVASIVDGPSLITNESSATFTLAADRDGVEFICSLDGALPALCTTPLTLTGLADGQHLLAVQAVDTEVGPTATRTWTVDTLDPTLSILTAPPAVTTGANATFTFVTAGAAAVICGLDGSVLTRCSSPVTYSGLALGTHTFTVAAIDAAGNIASASHTWRVTAPVDEAPVSTPGYTPVTPTRLTDTRDSIPVAAGTVIEIPIAGRAGIPTDADAVVANIAVINPTGDGYITVYPCGTRPGTASLNYRTGQIIGNELIAELSPTGSLCIYTLATTNLVVDITGYFPAAG